MTQTTELANMVQPKTTVQPVTTVSPKTRVLSLDVVRGTTIFLMILVNDPGDPQCVYPQLRHADWNGYTLADLVFPNFLFIAGSSLVLSIEPRLRQGESRGKIARSLLRRTMNLLLLKLFMAVVPTFRLRGIRIFGVLFRTALLALAGGLTLLLTTSIPALLAITGGLLAVYAFLLQHPFGTLNQPLLDRDNNLAAHVDRKIAHWFQRRLHTGVLYNVTHDPEGLLSSIPALGTVLLGASAALLLRHPRLSPAARCAVLASTGGAALGAGTVWNRSMPYNKQLWTPSYTLAAGGWSMLALAVAYAAFDLTPRHNRLQTALARPAQILGSNAILAYALSLMGHRISRLLHVEHEGHYLSVRTVAYRKTAARHGSSPLKSLAFAVGYAGLIFLPNLLLWRKKRFLKL